MFLSPLLPLCNVLTNTRINCNHVSTIFIVSPNRPVPPPPVSALSSYMQWTQQWKALTSSYLDFSPLHFSSVFSFLSFFFLTRTHTLSPLDCFLLYCLSVLLGSSAVPPLWLWSSLSVPSPVSLSSHRTTGMDKTISDRRCVDLREVFVTSLTFWLSPFTHTMEQSNLARTVFLWIEIMVRSFVQMSKAAPA